MRALVSATLAVAAAVSPAAADSGVILDPEGKPVRDADVCWELVPGVDGLCVPTNAQGRWMLPPSEGSSIIVRAEGFFPHRIEGAYDGKPIHLKRAASFRVRVYDSAGSAEVAEATVTVLSSDGRRRAFPPFGAGGLLVKTFPAGEVIFLASADGHRDSGPLKVTLVGGQQTDVMLRVGPARPGPD